MLAKDLVTIPFTKALSPEEKAYYESIMQGLDRQLGLAAEVLASPEFRDQQFQNQLQIDAFFRNSGIRDQVDKLIEYNAQDSQSFIDEFYRIGAGLGFKDINRHLAYTPADAEALYRLTEYNFTKIRNLNNILREGIRDVIFNAVASGEGHTTTVRRLMELPLEPYTYTYYRDGREIKVSIPARTRAEMIARTEQARAQNTGTLQAYCDYGVTEVEIITCGDKLVCDICMDLEENNPYSIYEAMKFLPAHPNCRCAYGAVAETITSDIPLDNPVIVDLTTMGE
jgi:SPP1 gp7 family putative phage head morphogenesis protein